jgi:hypothetical protein
MRLIFAILLTLMCLKTFAAIVVIGQSEQNFINNPATCDLTSTCDLKSFRFVEQKKRVTLPNVADKYAFYMTDTRAVYETQNVSQIEKYALVQQIKGCVFESNWDGKTEHKILNIVRNHMGKQVLFQHKHWQIDNDYAGPIYTGLEFNDGHVDFFYLLNWNNDPKSLEADNALRYGQQKPPHPVVFATDLPGTASLRENPPNFPQSAQNVSLEFNTCLFKTADVPTTTDADGTNVDFRKAVKCFSWNHKFIYDFKSKKFHSPQAIDPICLK